MLWAGVIAGGAGLILSVRYRVGAVVAAGVLGALAILCIGLFSDWTALATLATVGVMLCALNAGYVSGLGISCAWARLAFRDGEAAIAPRRPAAPHGIGLADLNR